MTATATQDSPLVGAIEAGGTKFVLAVGPSASRITHRHQITTRGPDETLAQAAEWFERQGAIGALGIATFGPARIDRRAHDWGHILATPKQGWSHFDLAGYFARRFAVPVGFDTDVNAAALAEHRLGAGKGLSGMAYITVGTGIGGGLVVNGHVVHGAGHPEMGHFFPRRADDDRGFTGTCPYHGDCLEGLASGPAILARWGDNLSNLAPDHQAHDIIAGYLAQLCHTLFACCAISRIVLGGGVTKRPGLVDLVNEKTRTLGAQYLPGHDEQCVVLPGLGENSGIIGAMLLGHEYG